MIENNRNEFKGVLFNIINSPAFIIVVFSMLFYITVASYYINFFNRLSLPFYTLNLPFSFYINAGYSLSGIIFYVAAFFLVFFIFLIPDKFLILPHLENASDNLKLNLFHLFGLTVLLAWVFILLSLSEFSIPFAFKNYFFVA